MRTFLIILLTATNITALAAVNHLLEKDEAQKKCTILDVDMLARNAYCRLNNFSKTKTVTEYIPRYIETECDCSIDYDKGFEEGNSFGWAECVNSYKMVLPSPERKKTLKSPRMKRESRKNIS